MQRIIQGDIARGIRQGRLIDRGRGGKEVKNREAGVEEDRGDDNKV